MATSIINYEGKHLDVDDNILQVSLYFIKKISGEISDKPNWFVKYTKEVIDSMLSVQPIGWGYMDLEEYLISKNEKDFFLNIIDNCIKYLKNRTSKIVNHGEINEILNLEGIEKWNEKHYLEINVIIYFLENIKLLINDSTSLNHSNLMKTN